MNGLVKLVAFTAPVLLLVVVLSFYLNREHSVKMDMQTAAFDRDWNEQMTHFAVSKSEQSRYEQRAEISQQAYSSMRGELQQKKQQVEQAETQMNGALKDIDSQLSAKANKIKDR